MLTRKEICKECFKDNGECLIEIGACPIHDYGDDYGTALVKEIREQNEYKNPITIIQR